MSYKYEDFRKLDFPLRLIEKHTFSMKWQVVEDAEGVFVVEGRKPYIGEMVKLINEKYGYKEED